jgi:hypothetical protein
MVLQQVQLRSLQVAHYTVESKRAPETALLERTLMVELKAATETAKIGLDLKLLLRCGTELKEDREPVHKTRVTEGETMTTIISESTASLA